MIEPNSVVVHGIKGATAINHSLGGLGWRMNLTEGSTAPQEVTGRGWRESLSLGSFQDMEKTSADVT